MSKKKGDTNYFTNGKEYLLKEAVDYLEKMKHLECPSSWRKGALYHWADKLGLEPVRANKKSKFYNSKDMYKLVRALEEYLKNSEKAEPVCKQAPQSIEQETTKANEVSEPILTQTSSGQMSIEDLRLAQFEELKRKVYEAVDLFINALADLFN